MVCVPAYPRVTLFPMLNKYNTAGIWRRLVPGYETVTLRVRNTIDGVATYRDYTIAHTKGRPTSTGESPMGGAVASGLRSKRWEMWRDALTDASAPTPKPGDIVVDGNGETWQVQRVEVKLFGNFIGLESQEVH